MQHVESQNNRSQGEESWLLEHHKGVQYKENPQENLSEFKPLDWLTLVVLIIQIRNDAIDILSGFLLLLVVLMVAIFFSCLLLLFILSNIVVCLVNVIFEESERRPQLDDECFYLLQSGNLIFQLFLHDSVLTPDTLVFILLILYHKSQLGG